MTGCGPLGAASITNLQKDDADHIATPRRGSWVTEKDGARADMRVSADYPIVADCKLCDVRVTLADRLQMEWRHVPANDCGAVR